MNAKLALTALGGTLLAGLLMTPSSSALSAFANSAAACDVLDPSNPFGQWVPHEFYSAQAAWNTIDVLASVSVSGSGTTTLPFSDSATGNWVSAPLGGNIQVQAFTPDGTRVPHGTNLFSQATADATALLATPIHAHDQHSAFCG